MPQDEKYHQRDILKAIALRFLALRIVFAQNNMPFE